VGFRERAQIRNVVAGKSGTQPGDGEIKAPPSVWRMWLVGFSILGKTGQWPAGAPSQNINTFKTSSASRPVLHVGCHYDKARR
jgi:hypothetical protein